MSGGVPAGELLPCPFCGAGSPTVWLYREDRKPPVEPQWVAHCKGCNITQKRRRADHAIAAWNTRATPTQPIEGRDANVERAREALTPSGATKAAYHGEFSFALYEGVSEEGNDQYRKVYVPWCTVKEIMAAIRARAAIQALGERG